MKDKLFPKPRDIQSMVTRPTTEFFEIEFDSISPSREYDIFTPRSFMSRAALGVHYERHAGTGFYVKTGVFALCLYENDRWKMMIAVLHKYTREDK